MYLIYIIKNKNYLKNNYIGRINIKIKLHIQILKYVMVKD